MWQSQVVIEYNSIVYLLCSRHCSAELQLGVGLICAALMHEWVSLIAGLEYGMEQWNGKWNGTVNVHNYS